MSSKPLELGGAFVVTEELERLPGDSLFPPKLHPNTNILEKQVSFQAG